jgi:hypothetical protein
MNDHEEENTVDWHLQHLQQQELSPLNAPPPFLRGVHAQQGLFSQTQTAAQAVMEDGLHLQLLQQEDTPEHLINTLTHTGRHLHNKWSPGKLTPAEILSIS